MKMRKLKHKRAAYYRSDSRLDKVLGSYLRRFLDYADLEILAFASCTGRSTGMSHLFEVPYGIAQR